MSERPYSSPLRDSQAQRTRELILDALTDLLATNSPQEVTTRAIAERAGVSQPTVYRHFPDRQALLEGLTARVEGLIDSDMTVQSLDDLVAKGTAALMVTEANAAAATAEALLNADPRRLSRASRERSEQLLQLVAESLPDYGERDHVLITALLRNLYSAQTWLRMREEFGIPGQESGPVIAWAFQTLVDEIRAGNFPRTERD
ncbi:MAG: helix-turn-helix domain-containing protein [Actinomycetota bacterium]|nr:helix-turn-helix domain-containing protein [Actinomycetota bacterium]